MQASDRFGPEVDISRRNFLRKWSLTDCRTGDRSIVECRLLKVDRVDISVFHFTLSLRVGVLEPISATMELSWAIFSSIAELRAWSAMSAVLVASARASS